MIDTLHLFEKYNLLLSGQDYQLLADEGGGPADKMLYF